MRLLFALALAALPVAASAQCRADVDCKGDRICVSGECRDPGTAQPPPAVDGTQLPPPPPPPEMMQPPPEALPPPLEPARDSNQPSAVRELPGWALGGAILGFVSAGVVGLLAAGSAATTGDLFPSLPLGGLATLIFAITVPLVASASGSVRNDTGASGVVGLRVVGWILYGLTLANAVVALVLGIVEEVPAPVIISLGTLGVLTEVFMAIDALVARGQAVSIVERNNAAARARRPSLRVVPVFAVLPTPSGGTLATLGLGGTF